MRESKSPKVPKKKVKNEVEEEVEADDEDDDDDDESAAAEETTAAESDVEVSPDEEEASISSTSKPVVDTKVYLNSLFIKKNISKTLVTPLLSCAHIHLLSSD